MIEFLLIFMIDERVVDRTQRFESVDRCLYFAERLTANQMFLMKMEKPGKIIAYCKPVRKTKLSDAHTEAKRYPSSVILP